ncbi:hypothetical protein DL766_006747 [Monosporascus sp. MC13-8B]|uniref:Tautomerase cis-CaaD-like domain-containing protein n=1 Tax=Monosporascus cannonballus TaxID=155416 RepID=A0ABY0H0K0_9PEZI|nr:hypothetical protein DL762_006981 [Monosporascus cannonballus]RYO84886.1 hypothetical protein DL763_007319 [Monosporascus cannonballus]RYP26362.1 hypothetical protein DL766_006747 [Monosporascus sp. MC13-8B]
MTTSHVEEVGGAFIRPGRADKKVQSRRTDKDVITRLFYIVHKHSDDGMLHKGKPIEDDETVERLAKDFVSRIQEFEFNMADVTEKGPPISFRDHPEQPCSFSEAQEPYLYISASLTTSKINAS